MLGVRLTSLATSPQATSTRDRKYQVDQKARCMKRFVPGIETQGRMPYLFEVKTTVRVLGICVLK